MCIPGLDPLTMAGLAASAGGALVNRNIQNDYIQAENAESQRMMAMEEKARRDEEVRQNALEKLQSDAVTKALFEMDGGDTVESVNQIVEDPTNKIVSSIEEYNTPALTGQASEGSVAEEIGRTVSAAADRTREMLKAAATLSGQGQAFGNMGEALRLMSGDVATAGTKRRGSMAVANRESSIPRAEIQRSDSLLGDLLLLGGQAAAGAGGRNMGVDARGNPVRPKPKPNVFDLRI